MMIWKQNTATYNRVAVILISAALLAVMFNSKVSNVLIMTASAVWLMRAGMNLRQGDRRHYWYVLLFCSYYLLGLISTVNSDNLPVAFQWLDGKLPLFGFPVIVILSPLGKKEIGWILDIFAFGLVLIAVSLISYGVFRYLTTGHKVLLVYTDLLAPVGLHPTYVSLFSSISIFHLYERRNNTDLLGNRKAIIYCAITILLCFIFSALSRAGIVGFMLVSLAFILYRLLSGKKSWKILAPIIVLLMIVYFLGPLISVRFGDTANQEPLADDQLGSTALHVKSWYCAVKLLSDHHLLTGYGTGDERDVLFTCYADEEWSEMIQMNLNAHNEYLSATLRHGIAGGGVVILMILIPALAAWRAREYLYLAFLFLVAVNFMSGSLNQYHGLVYYAAMNALLCKRTLLNLDPVRTDVKNT